MKNLYLLSLIIGITTLLALTSCGDQSSNSGGTPSPRGPGISGPLTGVWKFETVRCVKADGQETPPVSAKEAYPEMNISLIYDNDLIVLRTELSDPAGCVLSVKARLVEVKSNQFKYKDTASSCSDTCKCSKEPLEPNPKEVSVDYTYLGERIEFRTSVSDDETKKYCQHLSAPTEIQSFKK